MTDTNYANLSTVRPFSIGTETFTGDDILRAVAFGGNLKQDMAEVSSWIAYWGAKVSEAKAAWDKIETDYRKARDAYIADIRTNGVEDDNGKAVKVTKDLGEQMWRTHDEYDAWWSDQREAERAWNIASTTYEACLRKSQMLTAMGRLYLDEVTAAGRGIVPQQT
jgi:hypothetical protein